jgi:arginyl-tRNA synthetase
MNLYKDFKTEIAKVLQDLAAAGKLPATLDPARAVVEPPRDPSHGDLSTNAALVLSKDAGMKPRDFSPTGWPSCRA